MYSSPFLSTYPQGWGAVDKKNGWFLANKIKGF